MTAASLEVAVRKLDKRLRNQTDLALDTTGDVLQGQFRQVTARWSSASKPTFARLRSVNGAVTSLEIYPSGDEKKAQIFEWVDKGTDGPYPIPKAPRPPGAPLRFQTGYSARTKPGGKFNQGSGQASGGWASAYQVMHPGIEARDFSKELAEDILATLLLNVLRGIRRAAS